VQYNSSQAKLSVEVVKDHAALDGCLSIRKAVFVAEQQVPLDVEVDQHDDDAVHYLVRNGDDPIGTARVYPVGNTAKIGRVAVLSRWRRMGVGTLLMSFVLQDLRKQGYVNAMLDSQTYAIPFYEKFGFSAGGNEFLDAGIPHFRMQMKLQGECL
jgi:predicted GNAT family N-acyltransferase